MNDIDFLKACRKRDGKLYCWPTKGNGYSGKDLPSAHFRNVYDCSGLVTSSIFEASAGRIDWRGTHNAQKLLLCCDEVKVLDQVKPGDLVFYGPARNLINHVMVVVKNEGGNVEVYGACGGNSDVTSPDIAVKRGARVRTRTTYLYRPDFKAFGRLKFNP